MKIIDGIILSRSELEAKIKELEETFKSLTKSLVFKSDENVREANMYAYACGIQISFLRELLAKSKPLQPIVEQAYDEGLLKYTTKKTESSQNFKTKKQYLTREI